MGETVELKVKYDDHIVVHLAIGLHQIKHKSHIPLLSNYASFRENLEGNHDV